MSRKTQRVIPGFGISMGVTISILSIVVLIPLASLVVYSAKLEPKQFFTVITRDRVLSSFWVSISTSAVAAMVNAVMGTVIAWVLVRYSFSGRVAPLSHPFSKIGIKIAYTKIGITIALIFIGIPFVVRAVQPVLETLDATLEEAASVLGANRRVIFFHVILPELLPALFTGAALAFGRCLGEYGSVVFIAGNKPFSTEIAPLIIMAELQEYDYPAATSIALVMLAFSFLTLFLVNLVQSRNAKILGGAK